MRCAKEVLVTWHQCARRAAIERIDVEIDNLGIVDLSLELSLGSPREASTHALRMQAVLTALRHARAAEREAALRASDQEMAHEEVVLDLRKQLSEMSALLKQTEDKLMRATRHKTTASSGRPSTYRLKIFMECVAAILISSYYYEYGGRYYHTFLYTFVITVF